LGPGAWLPACKAAELVAFMMGVLRGGMGSHNSPKAGSIGSAIGPALGEDGRSLSQDLGACAPTATGHDPGHPCPCAGPGHGGSPSWVLVYFLLNIPTNKYSIPSRHPAFGSCQRISRLMASSRPPDAANHDQEPDHGGSPGLLGVQWFNTFLPGMLNLNLTHPEQMVHSRWESEHSLWSVARPHLEDLP
jgi:hypothetical protein